MDSTSNIETDSIVRELISNCGLFLCIAKHETQYKDYDSLSCSDLLKICYKTANLQGAIPFHEDQIYASIYIVIGIICMILNSLVISSVYVESNVLRTKQMYLRCSLAAADMLSGVALIAGGIMTVQTTLKEQKVMDNGLVLCKSNFEKYLNNSKFPFIEASYEQNQNARDELSSIIYIYDLWFPHVMRSSVTISFYTISLMALMRYHAIKHPMQHREISMKRFSFFILLVWLSAVPNIIFQLVYSSSQSDNEYNSTSYIDRRNSTAYIDNYNCTYDENEVPNSMYDDYNGTDYYDDYIEMEDSDNSNSMDYNNENGKYINDDYDITGLIDNYSVDYSDDYNSQLRFWFPTIFTFILPYCLTVTTTCVLCFTFFAKELQRNQHFNTKIMSTRLKENFRLLKMITLIVLGYTLTCLPYIVTSITLFYDGSQINLSTLYHFPKHQKGLKYQTVFIFMYSNAIIDFIVYSSFCPMFRAYIRNLFSLRAHRTSQPKRGKTVGKIAEAFF